MSTRKPAVAGRFYPATPAGIDRTLQEIRRHEQGCFSKDLPLKRIIGGVVPHAGYMFSGYQAVHFFECLRMSDTVFDTFVIVHPDHTGHGGSVELDNHESWETPYGKVALDREMMAELPFDVNPEVHRQEHSAEVMVPMLQFSLDTPFKILPVAMSRQNLSNAAWIAGEIARVGQMLNRKICVIASSDFSHYVDPEEGKVQDQFLIDKMLAFDAPGVYDVVRSNRISACGYGPIMTLICYAKRIDENARVALLKRGHSGEVIPSHEVVDYVSALFYSC